MVAGDRIFTVDEIAQRWGCARRSVLEAIHEQRLAAFRVGKRTYRIAEAALLRFEAANSEQAG